MDLKCKHGERLTLGNFSLICKNCNPITIRNGEKLTALFRGKNDALRQLLHELMAAAEEVVVDDKGQKRHFWAVRDPCGSLVRGDEKRAFFSILQVLDDPQVVFYDPSRQLVFVFNPFVKDQRWGLLQRDDGKVKKDLKVSQKDLTPKAKALIHDWLLPGQTEVDIPVDQIVPFRQGQSRKDGSPGFALESLQSLGESLKIDGQFFSIVLRKIGNGKYELVVGERRWRAAKLAGLSTLRASIMKAETPDEVVIKIMAAENANRVGLTPMETALEAQEVRHNLFMSVEEAARLLGETSAQIYRLLPLCQLPKEVQRIMIRTPDLLSVSQALELLKLTDPQDQIEAAEKWAKWKTESRNRGVRAESLPGAVMGQSDDEPQFALRTSAASRSGQRLSSSSRVNGPRKILALVPSAPRVDGLTPEEADFREMVKKLAADLPGFSRVVAETADRRLYLANWLRTSEGREKINFLLSQLENLGLRVERLHDEVNRRAGGQPPPPDEGDVEEESSLGQS